jgi:hypothetical protein
MTCFIFSPFHIRQIATALHWLLSRVQTNVMGGGEGISEIAGNGTPVVHPIANHFADSSISYLLL